MKKKKIAYIIMYHSVVVSTLTYSMAAKQGLPKVQVKNDGTRKGIQPLCGDNSDVEGNRNGKPIANDLLI